jgi:hypothetical protein
MPGRPDLSSRCEKDEMPNVPAAVGATLSGLAGGISPFGVGLFARPGPTFRATLTIDAQTQAPGASRIFRTGTPTEAVIRFGAAQDPADGSRSAVRTACIKLPDYHGPGRDQDFLLASSADGIPFHHAALPADGPGDRIYSSLWLYLSGVEPVVFGLRSDRLSNEVGVAPGDRFTFLTAGMLSRFAAAGALEIGDEIPDAAPAFAARNSGGGLRPLPPALFYRG